jgi:hypothetical protein
MSEKKIIIGGGVSFTTLLFVVFLILKLTNTITWSWWWVTLPVWIGPALGISVLLLLGLLFVLAVLCKVF